MPRMARLVLPNSPHHVVQRGHNKQVVFADVADFKNYLSNLRELKQALAVKVYAFCLMTNHVHLLLDPGDDPTALARLMKVLAARTTRYRNRLEGRTGTLWESRYRSSIVQNDTYLLACTRYIELNPIRARMVAHPSDYPWSSFNTLNFGLPPETEYDYLYTPEMHIPKKFKKIEFNTITGSVEHQPTPGLTIRCTISMAYNKP